MIKVMIADNYPLIREGIKKVLDEEIEIQLLEETESNENIFTALRNRLPDLVIVDITMPGKHGLALLKNLKLYYPALPVLILSIHPPERFAVRAFRAGAHGYLCKSGIPEELVKAIYRIVNRKKKYITAEVADLLSEQIYLNDGLLHDSLSDREYQVMCMIASGKEVKVIANELSLSPHTVHTYRTRIKEKMNLPSDVAIARYAINNSLVY